MTVSDDGRDSWQALGSVVEKLVSAATPAGFRGVTTAPSPGTDGASSYRRLTDYIEDKPRPGQSISADVYSLSAACGTQGEDAGVELEVGGVRSEPWSGSGSAEEAHTRLTAPGDKPIARRDWKRKGAGAEARRAASAIAAPARWPGSQRPRLIFVNPAYAATGG